MLATSIPHQTCRANFLPAFQFTLIAHHSLGRITRSERLRHFLSGVTAGVGGWIAATPGQLAPAA